MSDDLISRQAAINLAKDIRVPTKDGTIWIHRCIDPDDIRELPSAQPERKKGKWIGRSIKKGIEEWQSAKCSVCGRYHTTPFLYYFDAFKYCPNCGSYNGGGDDEADRR